MNDSKEEQKIEKLASKRKSDAIIKLMGKADTEVLLEALPALAGIADEASCNCITKYLDHADGSVRLAACKAALIIDTDYMQTHVRHALAIEKDAELKKSMQEALNEVRK